jgi:transcriptional regulator with XRE-family HTH domain
MRKIRPMSQGKRRPGYSGRRLPRPRRSLTTSLPQRIRYFRLRAELSGVELCARLGVTSGALSRWEHGSNTPTLEMIEQIAHECGVDPLRLLHSDEVPPPVLGKRNGKQRAA